MEGKGRGTERMGGKCKTVRRTGDRTTEKEKRKATDLQASSTQPIHTFALVAKWRRSRNKALHGLHL